jgi:hypothetical protein
MKRKLMTMVAGLAALALASLAMSVTPALGADGIRLAEQSCEVQADEQNVTGAEKDRFMLKCQSGMGTSSRIPITTSNKPNNGAGGQWRGGRGGFQTLADGYEFCDSLNVDDCVWVKVETGVTPAGVKITPPGLPITMGGALGGVQDRDGD